MNVMNKNTLGQHTFVTYKAYYLSDFYFCYVIQGRVDYISEIVELFFFFVFSEENNVH